MVSSLLSTVSAGVLVVSRVAGFVGEGVIKI